MIKKHIPIVMIVILKKCLIFIFALSALITFSLPSFGQRLLQPVQQAFAQIPANAYGDSNVRWWVEGIYFIKVEFRWGVAGAIWILPANQWQPGVPCPDWSMVSRFSPVNINPVLPQRQGEYPLTQNSLTRVGWQVWNIDGRDIQLSFSTYYQDSQWHRKGDFEYIVWFIANPSVWFYNDNQGASTTPPSTFQPIPGYWISSENNIYLIVAFWDRMEPTGDNCTVWCIFPADKNPVLGNELIKIKAEPVWPGGDLYSGKLYNPGFWRGGIPIQLKITPDKIVSTSDNAKFSLTRYRQ